MLLVLVLVLVLFFRSRLGPAVSGQRRSSRRPWEGSSAQSSFAHGSLEGGQEGVAGVDALRGGGNERKNE